MPFKITVLTNRARVIEWVPGTRGSVLADSLVNEKCVECGKPIGINTEFHEVNNRLHHAACLPVPRTVVGAL